MRSACCGQEKRSTCGARSSAGRQSKPWEHAGGWPECKTATAVREQGPNEPHCCAASTGKNKVTAGFLHHNTKVGSLCSICHSRFATKAPIYLFFSFSFFLETVSYQMSMNAVTLTNSVFTNQELKEKVEF